MLCCLLIHHVYLLSFLGCQRAALTDYYSTLVFDFIQAHRRKKPKRNPARIHSPDPFLRAGNPPRVCQILPPRKIVWQNRVRIEAPPHCPNTWRAEPKKEKCPFHFRKNPPPAKNKRARNIFSFLGCRAERGGG